MSKPLTLHFQQVDGFADWRERTSPESPIPGVGDLVYSEGNLYKVVERLWYFAQADSPNAKQGFWFPVVYFRVQKVDRTRVL